jgi:hypothetical protein
MYILVCVLTGGVLGVAKLHRGIVEDLIYENFVFVLAKAGPFGNMRDGNKCRKTVFYRTERGPKSRLVGPGN